MPNLLHHQFGFRRALRGSLHVGLVLLASSCMYSLVQGGLPGHIRTIAVLPFENSTVEAILSTEVQQQLQDRIPRDLGVRLAAPGVADALIRGRIVAIEEPPPTARAAEGGTGIQVLEREIRIVAETEIYDVRQNRPLYKANSLTAIGRFRPDTEASSVARARAITELARLIVQGAQSQW